jgi:hypothetical protein
MHPLQPDSLASQWPSEALEASLEAVERQLQALGASLRDRDASGIERHAAELHQLLSTAINRFSDASRHAGGVPQVLRHRLAVASGQVAAQRESLARATAALDRAIDVLMPAPLPVAVYGHSGHSERSATSGCLQA